ncbi:MAG: hypothetical protein HKN22_00245, partial [Bacteroidia bacterium]|nr:hypothetical protein [Bacteroidia bacterium]
METFIKKVAGEIYKNNSETLSDCCIVFPTRRACGTFTEELAKLLPKPTFSPAILTITDFILDQNELTVPHNLSLIVNLYQVYKKDFPELQFSKFLPWGKFILNDFDEIDRNLVDPHSLFRNLEDLKKMDHLLEYTDEQKLALDSFLHLFEKNERSELHENFLGIWEKLSELYDHYNKALEQKGFAYEGSCYKSFYEKLVSGKIKFDHSKIYFAGFYALSESEQLIFQFLTKEGIAECFWDTDQYYDGSTDQEAGKYLKKNKLLDSEYKWNSNYYRDGVKNITFTGVSERSGQAAFVSDLFIEGQSASKWNKDNTVLVLGDETLLLPILNHFPENVKKLNISMGYPIKASKFNEWLNILINVKRRAPREFIPSAILQQFLNHSFNVSLCADNDLRKELFERSRNDIDLPLSESAIIFDADLSKLLLSITSSAHDTFNFVVGMCTIVSKSIEEENEKIIIQTLIENLVELKGSIEAELHLLDSEDGWNLIKEVRNSISVPFDSGDGSGL